MLILERHTQPEGDAVAFGCVSARAGELGEIALSGGFERGKGK